MSDDLADQRLARRIAAILPGLRFVQQTQDTYTPTYQGGTTAGVTTYSLQTARYTRIGNIVRAEGFVVWTAATGTGDARISLPLPVGAGKGGTGGAVRLVNVTFASGSPEVVYAAGDSFFTMLSPATNAAGTVVQMEAAGNLGFMILYEVA